MCFKKHKDTKLEGQKKDAIHGMNHENAQYIGLLSCILGVVNSLFVFEIVGIQ